ncbi:protoheme IX farnesyltransferase [Schinkia azotoformans MEV2011]|uniref:Protoheme IX farnesyltransferase n=2 Tax=Schinkia azotoformans TaxID=1454 RepID=A0A072NVI6_SCHAZ|nr:heme o synthase [Schinkia azotoformans]KEF37250.1 protoheme IX farnesyltransferase [Schinkia azotoformans MEV2011]MEC1697366.1 heme o synthase [Schinkia azotoformans]MEC1724353.1 heme o synthase [Schinkia azotoformans]MEC1773278.1 heme o synthase [Schinkia azotoformans]MED4364906.1 heme o synthase [Schinkia azotoformans]
MSKDNNSSDLLADLKSLFKAGVLISNVLPVFTGFWLALHFTNGSFMENRGIFLLTIIGSTMVMAGALVLNNWYDVDIDRVMDRTKNRPTVTGNISLPTVFKMGIALTVLGFILLVFTTIEATIYAFIGWFTYVILYTMWSKRRYTINTMIGSISGAVTPLIGWAAIESSLHIVPLVMFLILFIWQMPHTFSIAMRKYDEYKAAGVAMLPVVHGFEITKRQIVIYIACLLPFPFFLESLGTIFIVLATFLNVGWLMIGISGFFKKDDLKWAHIIFLYSVNYLLILFVMMFIVTLPFFTL